MREVCWNGNKMEQLKDYIGNVFCVYVILSIIENIVSNEKYAKYLRLFGGIVMIFIVIKPVLGLWGSGNDTIDIGYFDFEISDEVYADILKAEKGRNEELINMYCSSVEEQIQNYLSETGYQLISCDTKINLDEGSDEYGRIIMLDIALKKEDKLYMGNDSGFYDYDVVTKSLSVNEEGAETVRYIFDRYVAGAGSTMIARELNEQGIPTIKGNPWTSSSVMGIINNEKYKGDILLGKTFTVDPISKRRLENLGEEDRFYIKNHHEAIISEETFARAQEIRERRNGGRKKGVAPGKREKFSRQYAFSCMLECGFCGANLSRRRWHSSSKYTKTIWQCVESTKHGKRFCPDSKGIPEQVIEDAFIESYRMLCMDHKDVLEEFIKRVEKTLLEDSIEDKIEKLNRSVYNIQYKRKKLLENYLEGVVAKDIYEETDMGYEKKLSEAKSQLSMLEQQYDNEGSLQRRLADFRKALSKNQILEEFDRGIFESIIEKVIVGGYDENGEKDPYKIIFIYKTGFKNEIGNAKERFGKKSKAVETVKEMCSHIVDEVKDVCSYVSDNTCGECLCFEKSR